MLGIRQRTSGAFYLQDVVMNDLHPSLAAAKARTRVAEYREFQDGELIAGTRYRVLQLIGVGGMGTVYEVEHVELGKRFVLKALLRELARREDLVIRLRNEWRALGRLEHPAIVTVTDAGTSATGVPFYVMERLDGETLAQRMRRVRRFAVAEAVDVAAQVLEGLAAAHQIGVVHRDIKPPNVFLLPGNRAKILDFGVAKIADDPGVITARGVAVGTPRYMSPEQARGERVDGRSDLYSTGLILYEMIAGVSPFDDARDPNELILAHLARAPLRLSELCMGVPSELDVIVASLLAKDHRKRPATAREAAQALHRVSMQLARSVRSSVPPASSSRRRPAPSTAGAVAPAEEHPRKDDTTRPDGVASHDKGTTTSVSAPPSLAWLEGTSGSAMVQSGLGDSSAPSVQAVVTTLHEPLGSGADRSEVSTAPGYATRTGTTGAGRRGAVTEMLTSVTTPEASATRTRLPEVELRPSETPPPVGPTGPVGAASDPDGTMKAAPTSSGVGWALVLSVLVVVALGSAGVVTVRSRSALPPPTAASQAVETTSGVAPASPGPASEPPAPASAASSAAPGPNASGVRSAVTPAPPAGATTSEPTEELPPAAPRPRPKKRRPVAPPGVVGSKAADSSDLAAARALPKPGSSGLPASGL